MLFTTGAVFLGALSYRGADTLSPEDVVRLVEAQTTIPYRFVLRGYRAQLCFQSREQARAGLTRLVQRFAGDSPPPQVVGWEDNFFSASRFSQDGEWVRVHAACGELTDGVTSWLTGFSDHELDVAKGPGAELPKGRERTISRAAWIRHVVSAGGGVRGSATLNASRLTYLTESACDGAELRTIEMGDGWTKMTIHHPHNFLYALDGINPSYSLVFAGSLRELVKQAKAGGSRCQMGTDALRLACSAELGPQRALWEVAFAVERRSLLVREYRIEIQKAAATEGTREHCFGGYIGPADFRMPAVAASLREEHEGTAEQGLAIVDAFIVSSISWTEGRGPGMAEGYTLVPPRGTKVQDMRYGEGPVVESVSEGESDYKVPDIRALLLKPADRGDDGQIRERR